MSALSSSVTGALSLLPACEQGQQCLGAVRQQSSSQVRSLAMQLLILVALTIWVIVFVLPNGALNSLSIL